jgi:LysM repeat protein
MRRLLPLLLVLAIASPGVGRAGEPVPPEAQELHELRQAVEQQSKQIEELTEQVGKLTRALVGGNAAEPVPRPAESAPTASVNGPTASATGPTTSVEAPKPAADPAAETARSEAVAKADAAPKAELPEGGTKHAVSKGETLTSIAKHYNISIADLKNANKIENDRKLQIGQILSVPTPKPSDTTEKKENP